nr:virulence RhuM family protein [Geothrix sp. 21YS21S-4]
MRLEEDTVWLTQRQMAELFQKDVRTISEHIRNIYEEGELEEEAVVRKFRNTASDGKSYETSFYNLDAIISVGYRVRSARGTQFRIWATQRLREYIVKGFVLDDERLKHPPAEDSGLPDHFSELLERIRDIRASERRMYLRVREIFTLASDYAPSQAETTKFFSIIQNKLHFAATGRTAAELILERADSTRPHMGLTHWTSGRVQKADVTVAKNYLREQEIDELNRIVVMWLDFAEDQSRRRKEIFLKDWTEKLDAFLTFNEREVLPGPGGVSKEQADLHATREYERFADQRRTQLEEEGEAFNLRTLEAASKARLSGKAPGVSTPGKRQKRR